MFCRTKLLKHRFLKMSTALRLFFNFIFYPPFFSFSFLTSITGIKQSCVIQPLSDFPCQKKYFFSASLQSMTIHAVLFARAELRGGGACPRGTEVSAQGPGGCVRCPQTCRLHSLFCRRSSHGQGGLRHQADQGGLHVQEDSVRQSRQETGGPCSQSPGHPGQRAGAWPAK